MWHTNALNKKYNSTLFLLLLCLGLFAPFAKVNATINSAEKLELTSSLPISSDNGSEVAEVEYLIITVSPFADYLQRLANWKSQKGVSAKILTINEITSQYSGADTQERIKECIQDYYTNRNTSWVLLAGDEQDVPSRQAYIPEIDIPYPRDGNTVSCDSYYTDLDNDWDSNNDGLWGDYDHDEFDYHAEVYVGRLTANDTSEMGMLVDNIISYETDPPEGDWIGRALYGGTILFYSEDWDDDDEADYLAGDYNRFNHMVNDTLDNMDVNWTTNFLAETEGLVPTNYYNDSLISEDNLIYALDAGNSIGVICGHGGYNGMVRTVFTTDLDGDGLFDRDGSMFDGAAAIDTTQNRPLINTGSPLASNQEKLGFYYLGGCSVGTFNAEGGDCLTEYFLKTTAIGCIGGSQVVWGEDEWIEREHGGWYSEGLTFRFFEQFMEFSRPGKALALAKEDYVSDLQNPAYADPSRPYYPSWENKTLKQINLFGDPEIPIWLEAPKHMDISLIESENNTLVKAEYDPEAPATNALVTITEENEILWEGNLNASGEILIPYSSLDLTEKTLTVYKEGYIPFQQLGLVPQEDTTVDGGIPGYSIDFLILAGVFSIYYLGRKTAKRKK
ncbi:MAG: C25 family cysteine peptidase [Promethearchaeota archaeon]